MIRLIYKKTLQSTKWKFNKKEKISNYSLQSNGEKNIAVFYRQYEIDGRRKKKSTIYTSIYSWKVPKFL